MSCTEFHLKLCLLRGYEKGCNLLGIEGLRKGTTYIRTSHRLLNGLLYRLRTDYCKDYYRECYREEYYKEHEKGLQKTNWTTLGVATRISIRVTTRITIM